MTKVRMERRRYELWLVSPEGEPVELLLATTSKDVVVAEARWYEELGQSVDVASSDGRRQWITWR
ncbi:MAG: hypothetical protein DRP85_09055 [Candidatus Makaraimicrobium thalassicum]|nr:MAG: hypothetical protein DRP85_09055 [Candidatus Omnitrophota bacterium]